MSTSIAILIGLVSAAASIGILLALSRDRALDLCAIFLPAIATVYMGSSLAGAPQTAVLEIGVATLFLVAAAIGRWNAPMVLVAGYAAHGLWDFLHEVGPLATALPAWYAPFCAAFDFSVAAFIAIVLLRPRAPVPVAA